MSLREEMDTRAVPCSLIWNPMSIRNMTLLSMRLMVQASGEVIPFYSGAMKLHGTPRNQEVDEVVRPNAFPM